MQLAKMNNSEFTRSLFLFLFFTIFTSSCSLINIHKCSEEESGALLLFKQNLFSFNDSKYGLSYYFNSNPTYLDNCQDWLGSSYYPILKSWNRNSDCCDWNGVTCDRYTGDVIGLDLSCGMLRGTIHSNSSLFHLPHLRRLNLALNNFTGSQIPREIGMLSNTLSHLNISRCGFSSQIPSEIALLYKLVSLDLSCNDKHFFLESQVLFNLLQNLTVLKELSLAYVNISSALPHYLNISSSLRLLNLDSTGLQGKLPHCLFNLQSLEELNLSNNSFIGHIPSQITLLSKLVRLRLISLPGLEIQPHVFLRFLQNCTFLVDLWVSEMSVGLVLPTYLNISSSVKSLFLVSIGLKGKLPENISKLQYLEVLCLSMNKLNGTLPLSLFSLQSLIGLFLDDNEFSGQIDVLEQGHVLQTFQRLTNLTLLELQHNNFRGKWDLGVLFSSLINLLSLNLSHNGVSVMTNNLKHHVNPMFYSLKLASCKIKVFPKFLQHMKYLLDLDLSDNEIHGIIPDWAGEIGRDTLLSLNLSNNFISGFPQFHWDRLESLYLQSNRIQGPFPKSICNMKNLYTLDVSNNGFRGAIPICFGNNTSSLFTMNLRNNHFQGTIPDSYHDCRFLEGFILNGNQLEGEVPSSLSKCQNLKVVDVGNNNLNGTFPNWLGDLPNLEVLVLKSNNFHGSIITSFTKLSFQSLQVLDLSNNSFVGQLPEKYFQNFKVMKNVVKTSKEPEYLFIGMDYYSIIITVKGVMQNFPRIFVHNTIIDVSQNRFHGVIPNIIGSLNSLKTLNLSHNHLEGRIPHALGNLCEIESLDLSWNQLIGEIPRDLANIKGLEVLNLSQNHLIGRIPDGTQFRTFDVSSFGGNLGLCGFPLAKCEHLGSQQHKGDGSHNDDDENGCTLKVVSLGFGCGTLIGFLLGYLMLSTGKPKWFNDISDLIEHMILKRRNKRRY